MGWFAIFSLVMVGYWLLCCVTGGLMDRLGFADEEIIPTVLLSPLGIFIALGAIIWRAIANKKVWRNQI
jgi:hypothetical protein